MAPSAKALKEALIEGTCAVFNLEPDATSVNKVRHHVEQKLSLEEDFFSGQDWKQKSKEIIKEYVGKLQDGWAPEEKKTDSKAPRKGSSKPENAVEDVQGSSSPDRKRKRATAESSSDVKGHDEDEPNKKAKSESKSPDAASDEEEEYSDVIDEPPTSKRKKTKKEPGQKAPKAAKPAKAATKKTSSRAAEPSDPLEADIKKLQGQLTKCGVRKLWHHELKGCADARAKIRHLKKMLADVGMEGRFSEAKAREIKETRELLADAEAAQEMNRLWGMDSGRRKNRSKSRGTKATESDGSDTDNDTGHHDGGKDDDEDEKQNGNGEEEDDEDVGFAARRRRAHADLAFLGDDSDSD
ncbi:hypothetical protein BBAD15_g3775 [Beauveria bassiana D1-5]|uniref:Transcriptional regulator n=1 Tax=Beauveria bassiana D1-5 TaxID=1245745 RepID=A0A0A2WCU7_BEABA|nr:hypothetical protein BBAD15_g3775 [Beauveria bassiana D1-5]